MAVDIGPRIGIDGEKQFRDELKNINQSLKTLDSEMKVVKSSFDGQKKSAEQLKKENEVLERSVLTLKDKLSQQEDALAKCAQKYGEADAKTMKWQQAVNETKAALNNAENAIKANTRAMDEYGNELAETQMHTSNFGESFKGTFAGIMASKGFMLVVQTVQKLAQAAKEAFISSAEYADAVNTLAAQTGLATDEIQEFMYMSELVDVDVDTLTGSLAKLVKSMNSARAGTGNATEAFKKLGISVTNNDGILRNNTEVFAEVIEALGQIEDVTERDALAMDIFGKSAQDLNPLILMGKDGIQALAEEANELGIVLAEKDLNTLNGMNDELYKLKEQIQKIEMDFVLEHAEEIEAVLEQVPGILEDTATILGSIIDLVATLLPGLTKVAHLITTVAAAADSSKDGNYYSFTGDFDAGEYTGGGGKKTQKGGARAAINIYPQSMTRGQTDYVISAANRALGGKL